MSKKLDDMIEANFVEATFIGTDEEVDKKYKCFLSKQCNDEKFDRIKKMYAFCKDLDSFAEYMGKEELAKLETSYGKKDKRGQSVMIDFSGMSANEAFIQYRMGVKEILRKGYVLNDDDTYSKK